MALVLDDRVKETSTTTGTGTLNLSGAVSGFQTFVAGVGDGNTTYYAIVNRDEDEWETGVGTITDATTDTLARTTVIASSNSDSAVDFSAGTKDVFTTLPASKVVFEDAGSDVTLPDDLILGSDSAVLKFGADSDTTLTHTDGTGLTLNSTNKLLFRDTALYINSSTDGQLDIVADTEVQIAATTIDINGAVAMDGAITGATNITLSGELDAATGDFSGDVDIDGTLEADAITVDGTALGTFIRDTVGTNMLSSNTESGISVTYDTTNDNIDFAISAAQTTITSILATDVKIGEDDQTKIDFETADTINFYAGNEKQLVLTDGALTPGTNAILDLGTDALEFKDAYFDGTVEADAITIGGTGIGSIYQVLAGSSDTVTTGALDSGSITSGFGAIDNGTSGIRTNTFTAETSIIPDAAGGADIGSTSAEWGDVFIADDKYIQFGNDQNVIVGYDEDGNDTLEFKANIEGAALAFTFSADQADDNADTWKLNFADGGDVTLQSYTSGSFATKLTLDTSGDLTVAGDLTVSGDDITLATNTDTAIMVADGTNFNPVVPSGDVGLTNAGVFSIASGVIVNADINASAAIADSKLDTISTANKINIGALDIDGATDIGAALADADLFIVDDNAGGTERKMAASRIITYVNANASFTTKGFAIAMSLIL